MSSFTPAQIVSRVTHIQASSAPVLLCLAHLHYVKGIRTRDSKLFLAKRYNGYLGTAWHRLLAQHQGDLWHMCFVSPSSSPTRHVGQSLCCVPWHWGNKDGLILVLCGLHKPALLSFHIHIFFRERGRWKTSIHENAASKLSVISRMEVSKHPPHFENTT